mmetsp:Transcript_1383/g.2283  ORF Transcript_1383/g.2283 Transcript_1383/m.2283 type:complete len:90 (+) Transcript_1383:499-768(+)
MYFFYNCSQCISGSMIVSFSPSSPVSRSTEPPIDTKVAEFIKAPKFQLLGLGTVPVGDSFVHVYAPFNVSNTHTSSKNRMCLSSLDNIA